MTERSMGLGALADAVAPDRVVGIPAGEVAALTAHSEEVTEGAAFFAIPGQVHDGWAFIPDAVERGALAVIAERETPDISVPQLIVANARHAVADAADAWFGRPSEQMRVYGITGTDGKSTTAFLSLAILIAAGRSPGLVGTVDTRVGDVQSASTSRTTTPEALELQALLADMVEAGNDCVVVEATSHGLAQARVRNCRFKVGIVTTITSEHLEFHGTLEAYRAAKAMLVEEAPVAVLNADDPNFDYLRQRAAGTIISFGIETDADLRASALDLGPRGSRFHVAGPRWEGAVALQLPARFNVANALAALGLAEAEGLDPERAAAALADVPGVPGRMERIDLGQPFGVVVDYAHTADSLGKVLRELRPLTAGRLIAVFGSAGDRDRTKRAPMGRVAAELADFVVVTDEDPRLEAPWEINEEIAQGARSAGGRDRETLWIIDDRRTAIAHALHLAEAGDMVLLAGKGHEPSIIYGDDRRWWDDREVARQELRSIGYETDEQPVA
jgi:UDP-N-acetylmuramoyl-L-alanyl-D-glutamate--2,6-diaminopimelate ligase